MAEKQTQSGSRLTAGDHYREMQVHMCPHSIHLRFLFPVLCLLLLSACSTTVNVDYDSNTNFTSIKRYTLLTRPVKVSDDPRIDSSLVQKRVVTAIHNNLQTKGLSESSQAEIQVSYRIDVQQAIETDSSGVSVGVGTFSRNVGIGFGYGFPASDVESYDQMMLTIDFRRTDGELLWRGSDTRRLESGSTPAKSTEMINKLVENILEQYPPN